MPYNEKKKKKGDRKRNSAGGGVLSNSSSTTFRTGRDEKTQRRRRYPCIQTQRDPSKGGKKKNVGLLGAGKVYKQRMETHDPLRVAEAYITFCWGRRGGPSKAYVAGGIKDLLLLSAKSGGHGEMLNTVQRNTCSPKSNPDRETS